MASSQSDLRKIGLEGFDLIDKLYGRRGPSANEGFWVVLQVPNGDMEKPALKPKDVNYGIPVANHPRGKTQSRWGRPIKFIN